MTAIARSRPVTNPLGERPVLAAAPLKPGFDRARMSRYADASWDLGPAVFRENTRRCHVTAHFETVADAGIRETLRALLYARLNIDLPGHRLKLPPASLRQAFNRVRRFLEFVHAEIGTVDLARVDQALLDSYVRRLRTDRNRSAVIIGQLLEPAFDLYTYRQYMPEGGLTFEPWAGRSAATVAGV